MQKKALVIIDIQNDITKNYKDVIGNINQAVDWAVDNKIHVIYIRHENLSAGTRTFKPGTPGAELVSDLKIVSKNVFTKCKGNALTSEGFAAFISENDICDFYIAGADAAACVNQPVITYVKPIIRLMSYQIALPVMTKEKLTKCCAIMKVRAVKSSL